MSKKNKKTENTDYNPKVELNIPDDEIWTYQIEGLAAPMIGKTVHNAKAKKVLVVAVLVVAISLSIFFSVRTVHSDTFNYNQLENGWEFVKFSNPGTYTELTIDFAEEDESKPITEIHEYAFNCDDKLITINIGKSVEKIDAKAIYSVWNLQNIFVDKDNPYYCDLDGVLYNKDMTEIVCYPIDHDKYLRTKFGYTDLKDDKGKPMEELWGPTKRYDDAFFQKYNDEVRTYVLPDTIEIIGKLSLNYANLTKIVLPEGVKRIEPLAFFKATSLSEIVTKTADGKEYTSLPEGLEFIGSDAFSYDQALTYIFIPASVKEIGHHTFWDTVYKEDGELKGVTEMHVALDEESFKASVTTGDHWLPWYDSGPLKKTISVNYGAERTTDS